jgi:predicted ester cyclase
MSEKRALLDDHREDAMARFIEGVNERCYDLLRSAFSTSWIDHQPEGPRGYDSFEAAVRSVVRAFPDFMLSIDERIDAGDRVIVRLTMTGTHQGVFFSRPPSGKLIAVRSHDIHRLVDDRIVESWQLEDWFALLEQIGGIDPMPTPADTRSVS